MAFPAKRIVFRATVDSPAAQKASEFLARRTGLSRERVKDAMSKGAAWVRSGRGRMTRMRRATKILKKGQSVELYYDDAVLSVSPPKARCLNDLKHYSVWHKPAGLLAQGTLYGDHCSLLRQAETHFTPSREVFLVHRLDREASGLMVLAHTREAAARLSALFRDSLLVKEYRIEVLGDAGGKARKGRIDLPLDGKPSLTEFEVESYDPVSNISVVSVRIMTGRLHQIRRHFAMINFPVIGDPRYGKGNKNKEGMKLSAVSLKFVCPYFKREVEFNAPKPESGGR